MRQNCLLREDQSLKSLRELSGRIGSNPNLVQASTGNTSFKLDDVLWIKASGKWLINAHTDDFLIPVSLTEARRCIRENTAIPETEQKYCGRLSASIETAMHVVLPQKVVIHVHSVNAISWAVRKDGPTQLDKRLSGFHWRWIPYTPSGLALARKIERDLVRYPQTNVLVLGNHGLVVCADCCQSAERLLSEIEECIAVEPRQMRQPGARFLEFAQSESTWSLPLQQEIHSLATDPDSCRILDTGVLYPCQAIFLPGTLPNTDKTPHCCYQNRKEKADRQTVQLWKGQGVLCRNDMSLAEKQMLLGLTRVVQRIGPSAPVRYLTNTELEHVLSDNITSYRRTADAGCN